MRDIYRLIEGLPEDVVQEVYEAHLKSAEELTVKDLGLILGMDERQIQAKKKREAKVKEARIKKLKEFAPHEIDYSELEKDKVKNLYNFLIRESFHSFFNRPIDHIAEHKKLNRHLELNMESKNPPIKTNPTNHRFLFLIPHNEISYQRIYKDVYYPEQLKKFKIAYDEYAKRPSVEYPGELFREGNLLNYFSSLPDGEVVTILGHTVKGKENLKLALPNGEMIPIDELHQAALDSKKQCIILSCHSPDFSIKGEIELSEALQMVDVLSKYSRYLSGTSSVQERAVLLKLVRYYNQSRRIAISYVKSGGLATTGALLSVHYLDTKKEPVKKERNHPERVSELESNPSQTHNKDINIKLLMRSEEWKNPDSSLHTYMPNLLLSQGIPELDEHSFAAFENYIKYIENDIDEAQLQYLAIMLHHFGNISKNPFLLELLLNSKFRYFDVRYLNIYMRKNLILQPRSDLEKAEHWIQTTLDASKSEKIDPHLRSMLTDFLIEHELTDGVPISFVEEIEARKEAVKRRKTYVFTLLALTLLSISLTAVFKINARKPNNLR